MQKAPRANFTWKLEEETFLFLILIHKIKGELNLLKFDRIKIREFNSLRSLNHGELQ